MCGVCADGYSFRSSTHRCEPCSDSAGMDAVTIVYIIIFVMLAVVVLYFYYNEDFRAKVKTTEDFYILLFTKLGLLDTTESSLSSIELAKNADAIRRRFSARVKIYTSLWQIVSLLPFVLDLKFPQVYESIASVLNIFNLGINVSSLVTCSSNSSFDAIDNLVFTTLYPVVVVGMLWVMQLIHIWVQRKKGTTTIWRISSVYYNVFLLFTYLILPLVSVIIFQTFSCQDVDPDDVEPGDDRYMTVDYSVSCVSSKYQFGFVWAIISIFVYPIGIPVYYIYVLYSAKYDIRSRGDSVKADDVRDRNIRLAPLKLLFELYKPRFWYWEVVETAYRLLLTGILVIIAQGSGVQIIVGIMVALFFLKLCDIYRPYDDEKVQLLRDISQWQIFFVLFVALLLKADFNSVNRAALDALLILAITVNIVVDGTHMVWNKCATGITATDVIAISKTVDTETTNPLTPPEAEFEDRFMGADNDGGAGTDDQGKEEGICMSVLASNTPAVVSTHDS